MKIEYVSVGTGEVLDVVALPGSGAREGSVTYATGRATGMVQGLMRRTRKSEHAVVAMLAQGWSNGYVLTRSAGAR